MDCKACGLPIDDHVAGRKLDACVANVVLEWDNIPRAYSVSQAPWSPSKNIRDAWEVHTNIKDRVFSLRMLYKQYFQEVVTRRIFKEVRGVMEFDDCFMLLEPADICLSALKAVSK